MSIISSLNVFCIVSKGSGVNMLKVGTKRRRTKAEVARDSSVGMGDARILNEKLKRMKAMEEELEQVKATAQNNQAASEILTNMINQGKARLEEDGSVTLIDTGSANNSPQK